MNTEFKQDTLEFPTVADTVETEMAMVLDNSIDQSIKRIRLIAKEKGVNSYHSSCNHPGRPCGSSTHGSGHGYCHYCKYCNP